MSLSKHLKTISSNNSISSLLFNKYILYDNNKINILIRKLFVTYSRSIRSIKLKYFFLWKYTLNIINTINHIEHKKQSDIHERLFNDYKTKEITLSNLTKRYENIECEKHPFIPKINKQNLNYLNENKINISIKKNNRDLCSNDKVSVSKRALYPINCSQSIQYNNYIIQS